MKLVYFISNFVPVAIAVLYLWRGKSLSKKTITLLGTLGVLGLINAIGENPALRWGIWSYNSDYNLGIKFLGVMFETYIYCILVPIAIGSAALKFAQREEKDKGDQ